jgi:hypothetical protein
MNAGALLGAASAGAQITPAPKLKIAALVLRTHSIMYQEITQESSLPKTGDRRVRFQG